VKAVTPAVVNIPDPPGERVRAPRDPRRRDHEGPPGRPGPGPGPFGGPPPGPFGGPGGPPGEPDEPDQGPPFGGPPGRPDMSGGSGVIIDPNGYIVTNNHVIDRASDIKVYLANKKEYPAKVIGADPKTDLAVIKIEATGLPHLKWSSYDELQVGDIVLAVGSPFGLSQTVTMGIVSALGRGNVGIADYEDFIQTDASINPGNSGGALVNLKGELIGIPSNILSRSGGNIGIGFAIPINQARNVMGQLIEHGTVERGRIGVVGQDVTPDLAKAFGLPSARGAVVAQIVPDSPAAKAGLKPEDIILEANGREVQSFLQLRNAVGLMRVGEKVELKVLREGKPRNVTVVVGKDTEVAAAGAALHPSLAGAMFAPLDEAAAKAADTKGILVQKVAPGSPAARTGLRPDDIVIAVNRESVDTMAKFEKLAGVQEGQLLMHVRRGPGALFLVVR
ncbi:MAG: Do family serine endopeptidase, partial [Panacagrimonas sp.]